MTNTLTILSILLTMNAFGQEVNFEMKAIKYFINKIESDTIFHEACDCVYEEYDTEKILTIFDSSYTVLIPQLALTAFQFEWVDSLLWTAVNIEKVQLQNDSELGRIKLTENSKDFNSNHYLVRFSSRLKYKNWTIIEFNIKSESKCSGINYLFLFNETGQIENHKKIIWCDSQG